LGGGWRDFLRAEALERASKQPMAEIRHARLFWRAQVAAWTGYGIVSFLGALPYVGVAPHLDSLRSAFFSKAAFAVAGFAASSVMRLVYRSQYRSKNRSQYGSENRREIPWIQVVSAIALSYAAGIFTAICSNEARVLAGGIYLGNGWLRLLGGGVNAWAVFLAWSACYFAARSYQALEEQKRDALRATALAHQAKLELLQSQVNPHFLFNALNSIHALAGEDPSRAQAAVEQLADFLRYALTKSHVPSVRLSEEIDTLNRYLALEKIRFEEKLLASVRIESGARDFRVPGFLLHPLLENAIKFGMQTSEMPLAVQVSAELAGDSVRLRVSNTGKWINGFGPAPHKAGTGVGLQLVRERLEQAFPGKHQFEIGEREGRVESVISIRTAVFEAE
jgi:two-component system LytT family sensor kinase